MTAALLTAAAGIRVCRDALLLRVVMCHAIFWRISETSRSTRCVQPTRFSFYLCRFQAGKFLITAGVDGYMLGVLTAGMSRVDPAGALQQVSKRDRACYGERACEIVCLYLLMSDYDSRLCQRSRAQFLLKTDFVRPFSNRCESRPWLL